MTAYVAGAEVPMTTGGEVTWFSYPLPSKEGYILLADPSDAQTAELLVHSEATIPKGESLGEGATEGEVFAHPRLGNSALKLFYHRDNDGNMPGTLPDLRVNVAVAYGLSHVRQRMPRWHVRAPAMKGAFLPRSAMTDTLFLKPPAETYESAIWLMERIRSIGWVNDVVPPLNSIQCSMLDDMFKEVTKRYCFAGARHDYDVEIEGEHSNLLVERMPQGRRKGSLVLIDSLALYGKDHPESSK